MDVKLAAVCWGTTVLRSHLPAAHQLLMVREEQACHWSLPIKLLQAKQGSHLSDSFPSYAEAVE